jgi:hypothetical protein
MIIRSLPYAEYSSLDQARQEGLRKEIQAAITGFESTRLEYSSIFGRSAEPLTQFNTNYGLEHEIGFRLRVAIMKERRFIWVPRLGKKTVISKARLYHKHFDHIIGKEIQTLSDIEAIYARTGWKLDSMTELRMSWLVSQIKPRIFYARGSTLHFHSASIIHRIFNALVDALASTHRRERFQLATLERIRQDFILVIYDYSSFTSNMREVKKFTQALADYFRGVSVEVLDGFEGFIEKDIGEILDDYNQHCNDFPEVDASEILGVEEFVFNHGAGMLGIPGNISSCTLLHGIHLAVILGSIMRGKVVGDDAISMFVGNEGWTRETIEEAISSLGEIAKDKMEFWFSAEFDPVDAWDYCKRPINRLDERAIQGDLIVWPTLNNSLEIRNPYHTQPRVDTKRSRLKRFITQHNRFLEDLSTQFNISEQEQSLIRAIEGQGFKHWNLLRHGGIDFDTSYLYGPVFSHDYTFDLHLSSLDPGTLLRLPVQYSLGSVTSLRVASEFYANSRDLVLRYAEQTSFLQDVSEYEYTLRGDLPDSLDITIFTRRPVSKYVVLEYPPSWLFTYLAIPSVP